MSARDWRCTAERGPSPMNARYVLTETAEGLFADDDADRPNPFGQVVKPRCRRCRKGLGECQGHRGEAS